MRISDWSSDVCSSDLTIAWLPEQRILFAGDLVEYQSTPYAGDCYFREWPHTLDTLAEFNAEKMVPGRGPALKSADEVRKGLAGTRAFLTDLYTCVNTGVADGKDLKTIYRETYDRSEEHTSELQSLMRISYAVFCLKKKKN